MSHLMPRVHFVRVQSRVIDEPDSFGWRLLGLNNRELGRSSVIEPSVTGAAAHAEWLKVECSAAVPHYLRAETGGRWTWSLIVGHEHVAHSARSFARQRESQYNVEAFLEALPLAQVRIPDSLTAIPLTSRSVFLSEPQGVRS